MTNKDIKTRKGIVISDKMDKTIVVKIDTVKTHPLYGKKFLRSKKFKVADPTNSYKAGDIVEISETKPLSKEKNFVVVLKNNKDNGKVK